MSNLILAQVVASYLSSWEGHTEVEGSNFIRLRDRLKIATIDEINLEYNALTQQLLWTDTLMDLFYDEIRYRMFDDTTFAISTAWFTINDWIRKPFVLIQVGFEDSYPVIDGDGSYILSDNRNISRFTLTNDSFSDDNIQEQITRLLLRHDVNAIVQLEQNQGVPTGKIQIIGLENANEPDDRIFFVSTINGEIIKIKAVIREPPDWNLIHQMYEALRIHKPVILDALQDQLINQLIDVQKAQNIIEDGGITMEGNLVLEAGSLEDYEEPVEIL